MRFAIGYPVRPDTAMDFVAMVEDYREHIAEVYFSWPGEASGRLPGPANEEARQRLLADLANCRALGFKTDLLFNAACYGEEAVSRILADRVTTTVKAAGGVDVVTTTSPAVAHVVKDRFPGVEVRASVNLRLRSVASFIPVADLFDSLYLARDVQRNLATLADVSGWCHEHGKQLCLLANSGCLRDCPTQGFHDNLMAHAGEVDEAELIHDLTPYACRRHLADPANRAAILQSTWIRPEDLTRYAPHVDQVKLATRQHDRPRMILEAYTTGSWPGNLLDLLEPTYSGIFAPRILDNEAFPADWVERTSTCDGTCHRCSYCGSVVGTAFA